MVVAFPYTVLSQKNPPRPEKGSQNYSKKKKYSRNLAQVWCNMENEDSLGPCKLKTRQRVVFNSTKGYPSDLFMQNVKNCKKYRFVKSGISWATMGTRLRSLKLTKTLVYIYVTKHSWKSNVTDTSEIVDTIMANTLVTLCWWYAVIDVSFTVLACETSWACTLDRMIMIIMIILLTILQLIYHYGNVLFWSYSLP